MGSRLRGNDVSSDVGRNIVTPAHAGVHAEHAKAMSASQTVQPKKNPLRKRAEVQN
jgi:hypothetical protein